MKNISLKTLLHFSDLAPIQIHNHTYSSVRIYFENTVYKRKLYFTQQKRTDNTVLYFPPSGKSVHFILYRKDKTRTVQKKSGRLVTLVLTEAISCCKKGDRSSRN
jgi:hypothetical protein